MTNWATTRLFITGPEEDLSRFILDCIRIIADMNDGDPTFDFEALVPMPDDVRTTMDNAKSEFSNSGFQPAPDRHWYWWRSENWGTKWPAVSFVGRRISKDIYDCRFETAWQTPYPVIRALAAAYPTLKGITGSYDYTVGCGEVGYFFDGSCEFTDIENDCINDRFNARLNDEDYDDPDGEFFDEDDFLEYKTKGLIFRPYQTWEDIASEAIDIGAPLGGGL